MSAVEGGAEVRLCQGRKLGLEGAGRPGEMEGEVDRARLAEGRTIGRAEDSRRDGVGSEIQESKRGPHRIGERSPLRQRQLAGQEAVGAGVDLDVFDRPSEPIAPPLCR